MRRYLVVMVCAAASLGTLGGCSSGSDNTSSKGSSGVAVEIVDNAFKPAQLTAQVGKKISVALKNDGATLHNFSIDGLGVSKDLEPGKKASVSFAPTATGTITFYCKYHQALGMTGTILVSG